MKELVELKGSENQIKWATDIRNLVMKDIEGHLEIFEAGLSDIKLQSRSTILTRYAMLKKTEEQLIKLCDAGKWITYFKYITKDEVDERLADFSEYKDYARQINSLLYRYEGFVNDFIGKYSELDIHELVNFAKKELEKINA